MAVSRFRNSGLTVGNTKYDSMLGGYPGLMAAPTATAGTESASVAFTTRSGISTYRVISSPGSITATGTSSPISVTGLTGGTAYTFQIRGENAVGNGAYSASSNSVTPTVATAFESIASATGTGSSDVITFSNIPGTYRHLQVRIMSRSTNTLGTSTRQINLRMNSDTGANYPWHEIRGDGTSVFANGYSAATGGNQIPLSGASVSETSAGNTMGVAIVDIHDYAVTTKNKTVTAICGAERNAGNNSQWINLVSGLWLNTAAITSLTFTLNVPNYTTSSVIALYGIKG